MTEHARTILITGCSSGIGLATARRFAERGWHVFASMRRPESGEALRAEAAQKGWRLQTPALDVTDDRSVTSAVAEVLAATGGRIDVVINNAGYLAFGPLEETTPAELAAQLDTNVVGTHRVARAVLPAMRAQGRGRLVFIGSISGRVALPMLAPYHASKWALEGMVEALRYEVRPFGVSVVLIEPGPFRTALHDNERGAAAAAAANASPYAPLLERYRAKSQAMRRSHLTPLINVIERASTTARPRLRWPVGPASFSGAYLRRLVPDRLYELLIRLTFKI